MSKSKTTTVTLKRTCRGKNKSVLEKFEKDGKTLKEHALDDDTFGQLRAAGCLEKVIGDVEEGEKPATDKVVELDKKPDPEKEPAKKQPKK